MPLALIAGCGRNGAKFCPCTYDEKAMNPILLATLLAASLVAALFGQGGGVLYTPIQVAAGTGFHEAAATSLFLVMVVSFSSTLVFRQAHDTNWKLALGLEAPTVIGSFAGGMVSHWLSDQALFFLLSGLLAIGAAFLILPPKHRPHRHSRQTARFWQLEVGGESHQLDLALMLPTMFVVGLLTSMAGIGGGILKVPIMVLLFRIPIHIAVGSSAFMVGLTAAAGLIGHAAVGDWNWQASLLLALPVLIGSQVGSRLSIRLGSSRLTHWFGSFLLAVAAYTALHAFSQL